MKSLVLTLFTLFSLSNLFAQEVQEQSKTMSMGPHSAFYVDIEGLDKKNAEREWKKYLKENFKKVKRNRKAKEFYTEDGKVNLINGSSPITIYSKIEERKGQSTIYAWVDLGDDLVSSKDHPEQAKGTEQFMSDFWLIGRKKAINMELEKEEKALKKLNGNLSKLEKKNSNLHKDIENYKQKISKAEAGIEENLKQQDDKRVEIEAQNKVIEEVTAKLNNLGKNK